MKKLIVKLLGLESLVTELALLKKQNEEFTNRIKHLDDEVNALEERVQEKIDEIETPDMDDFLREDDVNDRIESYLNDNDYVTQSYCDDEIESKVSDAVDEKVTEAIDDIDLESKVKEVVDEMDKASFGDTEEIEQAVSKAVAEVLSKAYNALKKGL
jgi:predicted nuclease with TOPRIM domain